MNIVHMASAKLTSKLTSKADSTGTIGIQANAFRSYLEESKAKLTS